MQRRGGQRHRPLGEFFYTAWFYDNAMIWYKNLLSLVTDRVTSDTLRPPHMAAHIPSLQRVSKHRSPHTTFVIFIKCCIFCCSSGQMALSLKPRDSMDTSELCYHAKKQPCILHAAEFYVRNLLIKQMFGLIL